MPTPYHRYPLRIFALACCLFAVPSLASADDAPVPETETETQTDAPAPTTEAAPEMADTYSEDNTTVDAPSSAAAQPAAVAQPLAISTELPPVWYEDLALNAFFSMAYMHNFSLTGSTPVQNQGRLFDADNDSFKIDLAQVVLQDEPESLGDVGFRLDIVHGLVIPTVLGGQDLALEQGYVSYIAPLGNGLRIDAGSFLSHIGAETVEGFDSYNDNYSRSLLFANATAKQLTGLRLFYAFNGILGLTGHVVNGWQANHFDNNTGKTYGLSVHFTPVQRLAFFAHYLGGPEQAGDNNHWRHLFDLVAVIRAKPFTLTLEALLGREAFVRGLHKEWAGALANLRWDPCDRFSVSLRGEYFDNSDGFSALLLPSKLWELTLTPTLKINDNAVLRVEARYDHAIDGARPFQSGQAGVAADHQTTIAANLLFVF